MSVAEILFVLAVMPLVGTLLYGTWQFHGRLSPDRTGCDAAERRKPRRVRIPRAPRTRGAAVPRAAQAAQTSAQAA